MGGSEVLSHRDRGPATAGAALQEDRLLAALQQNPPHTLLRSRGSFGPAPLCRRARRNVRLLPTQVW